MLAAWATAPSHLLLISSVKVVATRARRFDARRAEDPEGGAERTPLPEELLELVVAEGGVFREDERDVLGNAERGETRPPPGAHAFVLRGTSHVVRIGRRRFVIRTRIGAAGRRPGPCRGRDRAEGGAIEDWE